MSAARGGCASSQSRSTTNAPRRQTARSAPPWQRRLGSARASVHIEQRKRAEHEQAGVGEQVEVVLQCRRAAHEEPRRRARRPQRCQRCQRQRRHAPAAPPGDTFGHRHLKLHVPNGSAQHERVGHSKACTAHKASFKTCRCSCVCTAMAGARYSLVWHLYGTVKANEL